MDSDMALHDALALTHDAIKAAGYEYRVESIAALIGQESEQAYLHLEKLGQEYAASAWENRLVSRLKRGKF